MDEADSVDLMARWKAGDEQAAAAIFDRYVNRLIGMARSMLSERMRRRVEPEDVVQSVYRSFFQKAEADRYVLEKTGDLWKLLATITVSKVRGQVEFHTAQKRGVYTEESLNLGGSVYGLRPEAVADQPRPEDAAAVIEEVHVVLERLDPLQKQIFELALQNKDVDEISSEVQRSARTVRRTLQQVRTDLANRLSSSITD